MWAVDLTMDRRHWLSSRQGYGVAPYPKGERFFLYVTKYGEIFLEHKLIEIKSFLGQGTSEVYQYNDRQIQFYLLHGNQPNRSRPICIPINTLLDGVLTRIKGSSIITFVIVDALKVNDKNLTQMDLGSRIAEVKVV